MATQSGAPPNQMDEKPQFSASEDIHPVANDGQGVKVDVNEGTTVESVFVNSEPIREEQVQNAVKFLSHPKVKGSPVIHRRNFLERKGLTKEEIDEAFRRIPDAPPTATTSSPSITDKGGQLKPSSIVNPQALQNAPSAPVAAVTPTGTLFPSGFYRSHALPAIGLLAILGAGTVVIFMNSIVPRLKSWIRKVVFDDEDLAKRINSKPSLAEEVTAAAKSSASAAANVAQASQEMLLLKTEEKKYFGEFMSLVEMQVQELKSLSFFIRGLEGQGKILGKEDNKFTGTNTKPLYANGEANFLRSVRPLPSPAPVEPSTAPHPKSYMEIMAMVQRGERPPNIREINDLPPNPDQPLPAPQLAPRTKPWEVYQENINSLNSEMQDARPANGFNRDRSVSLSWVPPQQPPVAMPDAAEAVRKPKKTEQSEDSQFMARSEELVWKMRNVSGWDGLMEATNASSMASGNGEQKEGGSSS